MKYSILSTLTILLFIISCKKDTSPTAPNNDPYFGNNKVLYDEFENKPLVIVANQALNFMVAFERTLEDGTLLEFEPRQRKLPSILTDQEGNIWDINGKAIDGPRQGQRLKSLNSYIGLWFAWGTMFPGIELYDGTPYDGDFVQAPASEEWSIPTENVISVLGIDAIPAIDDPEFEEFSSKDFIDNGFFLDNEDMLVGVTINGTTRLYPVPILNYHEIVNDQIGDVYFSLSFCPLTGTAIAWDRAIDGDITTFGVSGLLYNSNVMPYDRNSESIWSQMKQECLKGSKIGTEMSTIQVLETSWEAWKQILGSPNLLTTNTGFSKNYDINPYAGYLSNQEALSYPVEYHDTRLPSKERVLGVVINDKAKAYRFQDFID